MADAGSALMGVGSSSGESRAADAAKEAISSPLLESAIDGATGMLLNITGGEDMGLFEVNEAADVVVETADKGANIIFGSVVDNTMGDELRVTVIATGFEGFELLARRPAEVRRRSRERAGIKRSDREMRSLEVSDDDIDIPPFLRDTVASQPAHRRRAVLGPRRPVGGADAGRSAWFTWSAEARASHPPARPRKRALSGRGAFGGGGELGTEVAGPLLRHLAT